MSGLGLVIVAPANALTGYGLHAIQIASHAISSGLNPYVRPTRRIEVFGATLPKWFAERIVHCPQRNEFELLLSHPSIVPTPRKRTAYFTMWESTKVPEKYVRNINCSDIVIVPCRWCRDVFIESGVIRPIYVVPLGIDGSLFYYREPPSIGRTVFSAAGRTSHGRNRKGLDEVIRCFSAAFPNEDDVELRIKCHPDDQLPEIKDGRISVVREHMSEDEVASWLAESHCFVSAATAEAWGLWQHQAMAVGRPVIASIFGGLSEFMDSTNSYPVRYRIKNTSEGFDGKWACPDLGDMAIQMRRVHANRPEAAAIGRDASDAVCGLTWDRSCRTLFTILSRHGHIHGRFRSGWRHQMPLLQHGDYSVKDTKSLEDQCRCMGFECGGVDFGVEPKHDEVIFNPSVTIHKGRELWFGRLSKVTKHGDRNPSCIVANGSIFECRQFEVESHEDPRAVSFDGSIAVSYTRFVNGVSATNEIAFLNERGEMRDIWHVNYGKNGSSPGTSTGSEKNWVWFFHEGCWHVVYWFNPMTVLRVERGIVTSEYKTDCVQKNWRHGVRHGGGSPTRVGDEYVGFCHSLLPWFGRDRSRYSISAYAFEAKPPFRITRLSRTPFLFSSDDDWDRNPCSCVICGGAVLVGDRWVLAVGSKDRHSHRITVPHRFVMEGMDYVEQSV